MSNSKEGNRDHFVSRFYLRRWAKVERDSICVTTWIEHRKELFWKYKSTKSVAFETGLYGDVEKRFFMPLDSNTADFINLFDKYDGKKTKKQKLSEEDSNLWAKYLLAQHIRTPEKISIIEKKYADRGIDDAIEQLPEIINNSRAISDLRNMLWIFATVSTRNKLITSDNPLIFKPNDLSHKSCVIILPMGPQSYFLATHPDNLARLEKNPQKMVSHINQEILMSAKERLFMRSKDSISESFIKKHWPKCT